MDVIGRIVGKYRIVEPIGKGGMGLVFKGYRPDLNHYAAIKILPTHLAEQPGFEERFTREAQAIAQLNHPNILSIIDFGHEEDGLTYLVTKYVTGYPLSDGRADGTAVVLRYLERWRRHRSRIVRPDSGRKLANILIDEAIGAAGRSGLVKILGNTE
jgi:serine/threonine protein kinase